jgi:hypothetical protein
MIKLVSSLTIGFYTGKNGKTFDIVSNFLDKLGKYSHNYTVYTDSYYGSWELAQYLHERNFYFTLSCGKNRPSFLFSECLHQDLEKGNCSSTVYTYDEIYALSFKDKKIFNVISNYGDPLAIITNKKGKSIPEVVDDYNHNMHGVDSGDRFVNMYMPSFRNRSWKFASLLGVLYITISNTTLFKNDLKPEKVCLKENLENLAFFLSPDPKISKNIQEKVYNGHIQITQTKRGICDFIKCSSNDKRTAILCSSCKKYFHQACFHRTHQS